MNQRIQQLAEQAKASIPTGTFGVEQWIEAYNKKLAELIVAECDQLNRAQSYELAGVVVDTEEGNGFDAVCLNTVKRVENYLANNTLKKYFGVEA
jgi:hypothetical protein